MVFIDRVWKADESIIQLVYDKRISANTSSYDPGRDERTLWDKISSRWYGRIRKMRRPRDQRNGIVIAVIRLCGPLCC